MATLPIASRSFERVLGGPSRNPEAAIGPHGRGARRTFYDRLLQVTIENDYYNESGSRCPDFSVHPTPPTLALMASLGLLYKGEGAGFSVLYDRGQKDALAAYLLRQQESDPHSWTRLTFTLAAGDPFFVSFTDIPIDTNPSQRNLYLSNRRVEGDARRAVFLPAGRIGRNDLRRVIPVQVEEAVSPEVQEVRVLDIAGQEVICKPRCVSRFAWEHKLPEAFTCRDAGDFRCTGVIFLDFSALPEDLYTIQKVGAGGILLQSREVVYNVSHPVSLCLLDLLFSAPNTLPPAGIYPVRFVSPTQAEFVPVHYVLRFERRSIKWRYFIVPPPLSRFQDLRIESEPAVEFRGPRQVVLANGRTAFRFVSVPSLPLMERSSYRFRLWGRHYLSTHEQVLVDRLPVPSGQRVVPSRRPGGPAHSDVFVYI